MTNFIKNILGRRKRKLYEQWVEMAELPPEEILPEDPSPNPVQEQGRPDDMPFQLNALATLYFMQGAGLLLLCVILILLIVQACWFPGAC